MTLLFAAQNIIRQDRRYRIRTILDNTSDAEYFNFTRMPKILINKIAIIHENKIMNKITTVKGI